MMHNQHKQSLHYKTKDEVANPPQVVTLWVYHASSFTPYYSIQLALLDPDPCHAAVTSCFIYFKRHS